MPSARNNDKEHKDQDLQNETTEDDVLAELYTVVVLGLNQHTSTTALDEKAQNIASHEDLGDPVGAYDGVRGGVGTHDQTSEDHVDRGGEQDGSNENEDRLDDVRRLGNGVIMCCSSRTVTDSLELGKASVEIPTGIAQ